MAELPPPIKHLGKYLKQATKLSKANKLLVAYYCRMYVLEQAMAIPLKDKSTMNFVRTLLVDLEKERAELGNPSKEQAKTDVTSFALTVFSGADDEDRASMATKLTAAAFMTVFLLLDVCRQFYQDHNLPEDLEEKYKYSKWKAADIAKAFKEGRKPKPGSANDDIDEEETELNRLNISDAQEEHHDETKFNPSSEPTPPNESPSQPYPTVSRPTPNVTNTQNPYPSYSMQSHQDRNTSTKSGGKKECPMKVILEAEKLFKAATNCLRFQDIGGCIFKANEAINLLNQYS